MIGIIDYGMGNLRSVSKAIESMGASVEITADPGILKKARGIVLPGVGAFPAGMRELEKRKLIEPIREAVTDGKPFLGICLGMQLLCDIGTEGVETAGLGLIRGRVVRFEGDMKIPHIGWNSLECVQKESRLLAGIPPGTYFYFVHSYYFDCTERDAIAGESEYGNSFTAALEKGNIFATQFHPEKSQRWGLRILENFVNFVRTLK